MTRYIIIPRPVSTPPGGGGGPQQGFGTNPNPPPSSGDPVVADSEVTLPPGGLYPHTDGKYILRTIVPLSDSSGDSAVLPDLYLDGKRAQVDGHSKTADGGWSTVLVSGPVTAKAAGQRHEIRETGSEQEPVVLWNDDLSALRLEIKVANVAQTFECDFFGYAASETLYDGAYLQQKRYWAPFVRTSGGSEEVLMCVVFVTRRADVPVYEFDVMISNSKVSTNESPFDTQDAVDGNVYFDYIKLTGLPMGWKTHSLFERAQDGNDKTQLVQSGDPYLVLPDPAAPSTCHVIGPKQCMVRRFVVGDPNLYRDEMDDIVQWRDRGLAYGANSYFMKQAFGGMKYAIQHPSTNLSYGGYTGKDAVIERLREEYVSTVATLEAGYDQGGRTWIDNNAQDWQHSSGSAGAGPGGPIQLEIFSGWFQNYYAHMLYRLEADARIETRPCFEYDIVDGKPADLHKWAQANNGTWVAYDLSTPGAVNKFPWDAWQGTGGDSGKMPLLQPNVGGGMDPEESLLPTTRPWNSKDPGVICPWEPAFLEEWEGSSALKYYEANKGTHMLRTYATSRALAWSTGDAVAREHLRVVAAFYVGPSHYGVQGFIRYNKNVTDPGTLLDCDATAAAYLAAGKDGLAFTESWDRSQHRVIVQSDRYALETDAYRDQAEELQRWQSYVDCWEVVADAKGATYRQAPSNSTGSSGNEAWKESVYGTTDISSRTGAVPDGRNSYPSGGLSDPPNDVCWDLHKTWQQMIANLGAFGAIRSILVGKDDQRAITLRTLIQTHCLSVLETLDGRVGPTSTEGRYYQWLPIGQSDPTNPTNLGQLTSFATTELWNEPNALGNWASWNLCLPWILYEIDGDYKWLERDLYMEGQYDPAAGEGNQDLAEWSEYLWTGSNPSQVLKYQDNTFQNDRGAGTRAVIQILSGAQQTWMDEQAP